MFCRWRKESAGKELLRRLEVDWEHLHGPSQAPAGADGPSPSLEANSLSRRPFVSLDQSLCRAPLGCELAELSLSVPALVLPGAAGSTCTSHGGLPAVAPGTWQQRHPGYSSLWSRTMVPATGCRGEEENFHVKVITSTLDLTARWFLPSPWMESPGYRLTLASALDFLAHVNISPCLYFQSFPAITAFVCVSAMLRNSSGFLCVTAQLWDFANV